MTKVEILTGAERQRRWSRELKLSILQEAFHSDGSVSAVARRHDILPQQIYAWRKRFSPGGLTSSEPALFIPVSIAASSNVPIDVSKDIGIPGAKDVEICLRNGRVLRISGDTDLELLSSLIACVEAA